MTPQPLDPAIVDAVALIDLGDLSVDRLVDFRVPFDIPVPDDKIDQISQWIDAGCP